MISLSLGLGLSARAVIGGGSTGPAPTLHAGSKPEITGLTTVGSTLDLAMALWDGSVDSQEYRLINEAGSEVYIDWTTADLDDQGTVPDTALNETLILQNRATYNGATSEVAESDPFGPIEAGETVILAKAWSRGAETLPAPWGPIQADGSNTVPDSSLYPQTNPNDGTLSWGFTNTATGIGNRTGDATTLVRGLISTSSGLSSESLRIDLPGAGTYRIFGLFTTTTAAFDPHLRVLQDTTSGTERYAMAKGVYTAINVGQIRDLAGNLYASGAAAIAASDPTMGTDMSCGIGVDITITGAGASIPIFIGRPVATGITQLACFAVVKVA